ncbi:MULTISPECIES: hypothetical protein [unclassified Streptomyces]|uniref:hypothetical protein n=1 Tax=unclassified Streptomyces TaxID=2593676 RepID=UPI002E331446|nr:MULTISPECIES: hypothetical protein [unclassified Streptomyces]
MDVLGIYLEMARARLAPPRFEAVIRAAQATCALLAEGHEALVAAPEGESFTKDLQCEYLGLLAVMITGSLDHRVIAVPGPAGSRPRARSVPVRRWAGRRPAGEGRRIRFGGDLDQSFHRGAGQDSAGEIRQAGALHQGRLVVQTMLDQLLDIPAIVTVLHRRTLGMIQRQWQAGINEGQANAALARQR